MYTLGQTLTLGAALGKKHSNYKKTEEEPLLTVKADFIVSENGMILQNSSEGKQSHERNSWLWNIDAANVPEIRHAARNFIKGTH